MASNDGVIEAARAALGAKLLDVRECVGEIALHARNGGAWTCSGA